MLPLVDILALSIPDAEVMLKQPITVAQMSDATKKGAFGPRFVLLKGGHLDDEPVDILYDGQNLHEYTSKRINTTHDNGSGCVFSSAIAAYLAQGAAIPEAVKNARAFMTSVLPHGKPVGNGHGPVQVFYHLWRKWK